MKAWAKQWVTTALPRPLAVRLWSGRQYRRRTRDFPQGMPRAHGLPGELVVSLTSYPPRYPTLHLTLLGLLRQDIAADRIVLWLARGDEVSLPKAVRKLLGQGVELRLVEDLRSYKKLVFALAAFPDAWVATADDDVFYKPDWLTWLVEGQGGEQDSITCHRAHRLTQDAQGRIAPYRDWVWDVEDAASRRPSVDVMPTGVGGILYPPGTLHPDVARRDLFERYAPSADDLWFYWCARRAGTTYRKVGPTFVQMGWWSSQQVRLFDDNIVQNDAQIAMLAEQFGNPLAMPRRTGPAASGD
ncbi:hypothetical protein [Novosphingobium sp.]|uniref:hypothetical protein n=1 Tax=Novosphingobium sp. TaxID=1874826 RepID=UPI002FDFDBBB